MLFQKPKNFLSLWTKKWCYVFSSAQKIRNNKMFQLFQLCYFYSIILLALTHTRTFFKKLNYSDGDSCPKKMMECAKSLLSTKFFTFFLRKILFCVVLLHFLCTSTSLTKGTSENYILDTSSIYHARCYQCSWASFYLKLYYTSKYLSVSIESFLLSYDSSSNGFAIPISSCKSTEWIQHCRKQCVACKFS